VLEVYAETSRLTSYTMFLGLCGWMLLTSTVSWDAACIDDGCQGVQTNSLLQSGSFQKKITAAALGDGLTETIEQEHGLEDNQTEAEVSVEGTCNLMILTNMFTSKPDPQYKVEVKPSFEYMERFYRSALATGVNVTILHDGLPDELVRSKTSPTVHFQWVNVSAYDPEYSLNDVRFLIFGDVIKRHPEWANIFNTDIRDVTIKRNPCLELRPGTLYAGSDSMSLREPVTSPSFHRLQEATTSQLGGKYSQWYHNLDNRTAALPLLNCGVLGGTRAVMSEVYSRMRDIFTDEHLAARQNGLPMNVDMGALNYVARNGFIFDVVTGAPVSSRFKMYEDQRTDVWFEHK
jgi:hypothetical protein